MSTPLSTVWRHTEEAVVAYLCEKLGHEPDQQGFTLGTLPRTMPYSDEEACFWLFAINGGPVPFQRNSREEVANPSWHMDAEFVARCGSDALATELGAALVLGPNPILPLFAGDVPGVTNLYPTEFPSRERRVIEATDAAHGGRPAIVYEIRIPLKIVFFATEPEEEGETA